MYEEFYKLIEQDIRDESKDNNKYLKLAQMAPTEKARRILTDIASEEKRHHDFLKEILSEKVSSEANKKNEPSTKNTELYAGNEKDYPDIIENAGVDPDGFM